MKIPEQIEQVAISRAANAAHYEYLAVVLRRVEEVRLENELWTKAVEDFKRAFAEEDKAFKQYAASTHTESIRQADEERDRLYASLRDSVKAFAKFPIAETAAAAEPLQRVIKNYKIRTSENYMKETGNVENLLQDMSTYATQLRKLQLDTLVAQLKTANEQVRTLLTTRNDERSTRVLGALKAARAEADEAYAAVVFFTNAYAAMNPDRREAADLVRRMSEDLRYFRTHAMTDPHRTRTASANEDEPEQAEGATE